MRTCALCRFIMDLPELTFPCSVCRDGEMLKLKEETKERKEDEDEPEDEGQD